MVMGKCTGEMEKFIKVNGSTIKKLDKVNIY